MRNEISQTHKCYVVCQVWKSLGIKNRLESCKDCLEKSDAGGGGKQKKKLGMKAITMPHIQI